MNSKLREKKTCHLSSPSHQAGLLTLILSLNLTTSLTCSKFLRSFFWGKSGHLCKIGGNNGIS